MHSLLHRLPIVSVMCIALLGLGSLYAGGKVFNASDNYTLMATLSYSIPMALAVVVLWLVGNLQALRPSLLHFRQVITKGWPALLMGLFMATVSTLAGDARGETVAVSILWFFVTIFFTAAFEEFLCRAGMQHLLAKAGFQAFPRVMLTAGIFGLMHFVNLIGQPEKLNDTIAQVGYAFSLGVLLGAIYITSQNVWVTITIHYLFNVLGDFGSLVHGAVTAATGMPIAAAIIVWVLSLPSLIAGLVILRRLKGK